MLNPQCIRIFKSAEAANWAKKILEEADIKSVIKEDHFNGVPIKRFGVPSRFRLIIERENIPRAAEFLAKKLKNNT